MEPERLDYPLNADSAVLELGGYIGVFSEAVTKKFDCHLYAFEPIRRFYEKLKRLESPKVHIFKYGIGGSDRRERISVRNDSSSVYLESTNGEYEEIEVRALKGVLDELKIGEVHLAQINQEGAELETLEHILAEGYADRFRDLAIQFHSFAPDAERRRDKIREGLSRTHTETFCVPYVWEGWRRR